MEILGWIICLGIASMSALLAIAVFFGTNAVTGKFGYEWFLPAVLSVVLWYIVISNAPFSIIPK